MIPIHSLTGSETGKTKLPEQFDEPYRPDLIKRAVLAQQTHKIQPTAPKLHAGNDFSAYVSKRRREFRGTYGAGRSRTSRKVMSRKGSRFNFRGAQVPQTVGGRVAHPPRLEKVWSEKINDKERRKAIRSALHATTIKEIVADRGHRVSHVKDLPLIVENKIEELSKTKEVISLLVKLGLVAELNKTRNRKIRGKTGHQTTHTREDPRLSWAPGGPAKSR